MLTESNDFRRAAKSNPRTCTAKLEIIWTDPETDPSISVSSNDANRAALLPQVCDGEYNILRKWAHFDYDHDGAGGGFKLDGTFNPMPSESSTTFNQVGWYGRNRFNADGSYPAAVPPNLRVDFDARAILSLFVAGESYYQEYPVDFDILLYSGGQGGSPFTLEHTEEIRDNTELIWQKSISDLGLNDITRMQLEILKWNVPNRVVKISEFYTSFLQTIENEDITRFSLLEERLVADGSLPIGNISSNEIDISLQNIKIEVEGTEIIDPFFPSNPNSPYYTFLAKNRKVTPYIGFDYGSGVEYSKLGTFWTGDWDVNEQSATCSVSCRDRMEQLRSAEFKGSTLYTDENLYTIMESILTHARNNIPMLDLVWDIDTELSNYEIPYAWFPKKSYFNTIKTIVEACMGQAYMSRDDVLIIEGPTANL